MQRIRVRTSRRRNDDVWGGDGNDTLRGENGADDVHGQQSVARARTHFLVDPAPICALLLPDEAAQPCISGLLDASLGSNH
jgi:hypothetical protein